MEKTIYDLSGKEGNAFALMAKISDVDPSYTLEALFKLNYYSILRKFEEICGHKYHIVKYPAGYERFS